MFSTRLLNKNLKSLFNLQKYSLLEKLNLNPLKSFKSRSHKRHDDDEIISFYGEEISIMIPQPLETLLSCLNACELKCIVHWAKENNVPIERLEVATEASYDTRGPTKDAEGKDISHQKLSSDEQQQGKKEQQMDQRDPKQQEDQRGNQQNLKDSSQQQKGKVEDQMDQRDPKQQDQREGFQQEGNTQQQVEKSIKASSGQTDKYRNRRNFYEEVNMDILIKTSEKDKNKVLELLNKGHGTCPITNILTQAGIKINTKYNIL
jgi:uncharacterized OsmC-like protein